MFHCRLLVTLAMVAFLLGASACSTTAGGPDQPIVPNLSSRDDVICKRQRPVGSHIPVTVCRTRAQIEADQQAAMRTFGPLAPMGGSEPRKPPN